MKLFPFLLAMIVFLTGPLVSLADIKYSVGGSLDLRGQYYPDTLSPEVNQWLGMANGELNGSLKTGWLLIKARPTGHLDPANKTFTEREWGDLPEGYAQLKVPLAESISMALRLGWDTFTWGVTDGFNPVDVVSARRYSDPLRSEKLGVPAAMGRLDFGFVLLEGIFIHEQRKSILPGENSRWLPREIGGDVFIENTLFHPPTVPTYYYRDPVEYDGALKNNFGARVSSHFLGMDVAGYFFEGAATVPATSLKLKGTVTGINLGGSPEFVINADPAIGLRPIYHRVKMTGASIMFPVWELIVRGEVAVTTDYRKNSASITEKATEAVLELEHSFAWGNRSLTLIGLTTWADNQETSGTTTNTPSLSRMFDRGVAVGMRWQPVPEWSADGYTLFDTKYGGKLFKLDTSYSLSDAWKLFGTGEKFDGKVTTPIGVYRKNDRVEAGVRVSI